MSQPDEDDPSSPWEESDALSQMTALLRVTAETLRYMAAAGPAEARPPTLAAAAEIEMAVRRLRQAADAASRDAELRAGGGRGDVPVCH